MTFKYGNIFFVNPSLSEHKRLINSFKNIFIENNDNNITHISCYFHFLENCRKRLQKEGSSSKENIGDYSMTMNFISQLPSMYSIKNNIQKKLHFFKEYFLDQWVRFFRNKDLCLNNISIKFRTNNA